MTEKEFEKVVENLTSAILSQRATFQDAIQEEFYQNLNQIDFDNVIKILDRHKEIATDGRLDGERIAVICKGNPEITVQILLAALKNNIHVKLITLNYHIINNCIFNLLSEIMHELKIPNSYLNYSDTYYEQDIIDRSNGFDRIIYIGSYFDYQNFEYSCESDKVVFWNDNNIKILLISYEYKETCKATVRYLYANNVEVEIYDDEKEFVQEFEDGECALIYTNEDKEEILEKINPRIVKFNEFNIEDFKFNINDLILGLDFSVKL